MYKFYCFLLFSSSVFSQTFYTIGQDNLSGAANCEAVDLSTCTATTVTVSLNAITEVAVDSQDNLYFLQNGKLYKKEHNQSNAELLGTFPDFSPSQSPVMNALVADSYGNIYAAGNKSTSPLESHLYRYTPAGGIVDLGVLPSQRLSTGDLFFFENRLFLTTHIGSNNQRALMEINIENLSQSSIYMGLDNITAYGAFSTFTGGVSKCYLLMRGFIAGKIFELDIPNQTITELSCGINQMVNGGACHYPFSDPLQTRPHTAVSPFAIENPVNDYIKFNGIKNNVIQQISLSDLSGKMVRRFDISQSVFPVSDIDSGLYLLYIETTSNEKYSQKILIRH